MRSSMRRVAKISAAARSAKPRGSRAFTPLSFALFIARSLGPGAGMSSPLAEGKRSRSLRLPPPLWGRHRRPSAAVLERTRCEASLCRALSAREPGGGGRSAESNKYPSPHPSPMSTSDFSDLDKLSMAELGNTRVRLGEGAQCGLVGAKCEPPATGGRVPQPARRFRLSAAAAIPGHAPGAARPKSIREAAMPQARSEAVATAVPNDLEPFWIPFTPNRAFKKAPRLIARAKGMHYYTVDGRAVLDGTAGLWCCNAGHGRDEIAGAIARQAAELDYSPAFQFSHPKAFELAARLAQLAPGALDHAFFCNSGSEAVDTALKIALAYHNVRGQASRVRLIGRERGHHGVGFGGISVGGIVANPKYFGALLAGVDHLPHTYNPEQQAFTVGEPEWGVHLADELDRLVALHDAATIAAVIVEPIAASTGVLPPPKGYLQRLRAICDKHGILLIFDEVITGFGRVGATFAAERYGVLPDMMTVAK